MNRKLMIATPAFGGKVNIAYTLSFTRTVTFLMQNNVDIMPLIVPSSSLLVAERNRILEAFWQSGCTHLLMIDSDLGWPAEAVLAMLNSKKEIIAGCYPARTEANAFIFRPHYNDNGSIIQDGNLLKMEYIPAGFVMITREALGQIRDKFPELYYSPKDPNSDKESTYLIFNTEVWEGEFWGEDYVFCRRAAQAGLDIWVDPMIQFDHDGKIGMLMNVLTQDPNKAAPTVEEYLKIVEQNKQEKAA